jgi:hypothetical protein
VAEDETQLDAVRAKQISTTTMGSRPSCLTTETLHEAEPNLRRGLAGGLLVPSDGVIYRRRRRSRCSRSRGLGVEVLERMPVEEIVPGGVRCGLDTFAPTWSSTPRARPRHR